MSDLKLVIVFLELGEMLFDCVLVFPLVPVFVCGFPACVFVFVPLVVVAGALVF